MRYFWFPCPTGQLCSSYLSVVPVACLHAHSYSCVNDVPRNSPGDWTFLGPRNCALASSFENSTHFRDTQALTVCADEIPIALGTDIYTM